MKFETTVDTYGYLPTVVNKFRSFFGLVLGRDNCDQQTCFRAS